MGNMKKYKIGNVNVQNIDNYKNKDDAVYSDGSVEDDLLQMFKKGISEAEVENILEDNPSWPIRYHLSKSRKNLLNWYEFPTGSNILEVGSGCGAITETLVDNDGVKVVANELSERRATINAYRNKKSKNLDIIIGNLQDYNPTVKFDYVVCVGVLEYAGTFIDSETPYDEFITLLRKFLKPNGKLLLAIENKMGFKYLSGAREDHTGGNFDGVNNYPLEKKVRTFGKAELDKLLISNGFRKNFFYYPHPDYKLPEVTYSDDYLPGIHCRMPKNIVTAPNYDQPRYHLFSEQMFVDNLEKNKIFDTFANSFLVEASLGVDENKDKVVFNLNRLNRHIDHRIATTAHKINNNLYFKKTAKGNSKSLKHLSSLLETYKILNQKSSSEKINIIEVARPKQESDGSVSFNRIKGLSVEDALLDAIIEGNRSAVDELIKRYGQVIDFFSKRKQISFNDKKEATLFSAKAKKIYGSTKAITQGVLDFNFDNIIIEETTGKWWLIDYEWRMDTELPADFVKYRAFTAFFTRYKDLISLRSKNEIIFNNEVMAVPEYILKPSGLTYAGLVETYKTENKLQDMLGIPNSNPSDISNFKKTDYPSFYLDEVNVAIKSKQSEIEDAKQQVDQLSTEISAIKRSRSFKATNKIKKILGR